MNTIKFSVNLIALCLLGLVGCLEFKSMASSSSLKLPALFSDHMVLQQKIACPVWGWATDGTQVTVQINGQIEKTIAQEGRWQVQLPAMEAGGPYPLSVSTPEYTIELQDVLVGEVWVCSGQSNMEWPVESSTHAEAEIAEAQYPNLRLFTVEKATDPGTIASNVSDPWDRENRIYRHAFTMPC